MRIALRTRIRADRIEEYERRMAELLDPPHDYSAGGGDAALPVVWQLSP
jgi:hypothetical protein